MRTRRQSIGTPVTWRRPHASLLIDFVGWTWCSTCEIRVLPLRPPIPRSALCGSTSHVLSCSTSPTGYQGGHRTNCRSISGNKALTPYSQWHTRARESKTCYVRLWSPRSRNSAWLVQLHLWRAFRTWGNRLSSTPSGNNTAMRARKRRGPKSPRLARGQVLLVTSRTFRQVCWRWGSAQYRRTFCGNCGCEWPAGVLGSRGVSCRLARHHGAESG